MTDVRRVIAVIAAAALLVPTASVHGSSTRVISQRERKLGSPAGCLRELKRQRDRLKAEDRRASQEQGEEVDRFMDDEPDLFSVILSWNVEARIRRVECEGAVLRITDTGHLPSIRPPDPPPPPPPPPALPANAPSAKTASPG